MNTNPIITPPELEINHRNLPRILRLAAVVLISGILIGLATYAMRRLITLISTWVLYGLKPESINFRLLWLPFAGIVLTAIFMRYIMRNDVSRGTFYVKQHLREGKYMLSPKLMWESIVACSITLGFGGSAGSEGPSAYTGAAIGSNIGRWFGLSGDHLRLLLACGAGAGIAGIFKAPFGGMFYVLEVVGLSMGTTSVIILGAMCLVTYVTQLALTNFTLDMAFDPGRVFDLSYLGWYFLLGVVCGLYCLWYNYSKVKATCYIRSISNPWLKNLAAGVALGPAIFLFPILYGDGYSVLSRISALDLRTLVECGPWNMWQSAPVVLMLILAAALSVKGILVAVCNNGGGCSGDFAPTLFAGGLLGTLFVLFINHFMGAHLPMSHFLLIGMAAVMAGTIEAPLMAIFITAEMSGTMTFMLPMAIVSVICYAIVKSAPLITDNSDFARILHKNRYHIS